MSRVPPLVLALFLVAAAPLTTRAQQRPAQPATPAPQKPINFETYDPVSMLVVPGAPVTRARFPFVDVHGHQRRVTEESVAAVVREMDAMNMAIMVNLSGGSGESLARNVALMERVAPGRFATFANLNFQGINDPDWGARAAAQLERDVRVGGAKGLKIFKNLGMDIRDAEGRRIPTNDPRFDPVWAKAGELGIPVLIHTAEPPAFFLPVDSTNERLLEVTLYPNRAMPQDVFPPFETLMAEQHAVFRKHRGTTFINAHLGWYGQDLARLGQLMDEFPNMVAELGAVIYEPARQPRTARAFFIKYQDRILMGKDSWVPSEYGTYFRVLETADEYFPYHKKYHAFWRMYGLDLPDEVLRKVYYGNAVRVVPGLDASRFPR
jgi:predicted TIM-barrel fold metal-dependent hydrolase